MNPNEKRPSPSEAHRSHYKRSSISKSPEDAHQKRLALDHQLRKQHREQLVTAKRFRKVDAVAITGDEEEPEYDLSQQELEKIRHKLKNADHEIRIRGLKQLNIYLVDPPATVKEFVIKGDCVDVLMQFISGTDPEEQLQATWCITNLAGGPAEICEKVLPTVPYLISYLDGQNTALQDQAAWAIGNIAAEADNFREQLRANGALLPLSRLLNSADKRLVQTVCFALSNLARGPNARINEYFTSGIATQLLRHLATDDMCEIVSELCWVLTYLTCGDHTFSTALLNDGLAALLVKHMPALAKNGPLALPLVRTLGNIASGPDQHTVALLREEGLLQAMLEYVQSECRSLKKESLWVMSNITAERSPEDLAQVIQAGFIPVLASIATHDNFDIRKEAAFSIIHIASHGEVYMRMLPQQELLPGVLDFIRSQDSELIRLGLTYLQLLLTTLPEGRKLMSSIPNAIDALESITLMEEEELRRTASALMDKYFGEDGGGGSEAGGEKGEKGEKDGLAV